MFHHLLRGWTQDYRSELVRKISRAWDTAKQKIGAAQKAQKVQYDWTAVESVGNQVIFYMPSTVQGKERKLARPFHTALSKYNYCNSQ